MPLETAWPQTNEWFRFRTQKDCALSLSPFPLWDVLQYLSAQDFSHTTEGKKVRRKMMTAKGVLSFLSYPLSCHSMGVGLRVQRLTPDAPPNAVTPQELLHPAPEDVYKDFYLTEHLRVGIPPAPLRWNPVRSPFPAGTIPAQGRHPGA